MKILDIYGTDMASKTEIEQVFPGAELTSVHIGGIGEHIVSNYDIVIFNQSLMYLAPNEVPKVFERVVNGLNPRGEIWMLTPSLDWAANVITYGYTAPALQSVLYGYGKGGYKTGYTVAMLRGLVEKFGLVTRLAQQEPMQVQMADGSQAQAMSNRVIGWKAP